MKVYKCPKCKQTNDFLLFKEFYDDYSAGIYAHNDFEHRETNSWGDEGYAVLRTEFICEYCDKVIATTQDDADALLISVCNSCGKPVEEWAEYCPSCFEDEYR